MLYWEKSASGVQEANSDTQEDNDKFKIQKPHMQNDEDKEHFTDLVVNTFFIFALQMSINCNSARFGMKQF